MDEHGVEYVKIRPRTNEGGWRGQIIRQVNVTPPINDTGSYTVNGITLIQLIDLSYELCDIIHEEYKSIVDELLGMITARLIDLNDKIDEDESLQMMQRYEGEMYLRQLYCKLKEQLMNDLGKQGSLLLYVGSRQQCLYGCICFVLTFFSSLCWLGQVIGLKAIWSTMNKAEFDRNYDAIDEMQEGILF